MLTQVKKNDKFKSRFDFLKRKICQINKKIKKLKKVIDFVIKI